MTACQAAAVSLIVVGAYVHVAERVETLRLVYLGVPACFVAGVTALRIGQELYWPTEPGSTAPGNEPRGVLSQAEASERIDEFLYDLWERERWDS